MSIVGLVCHDLGLLVLVATYISVSAWGEFRLSDWLPLSLGVGLLVAGIGIIVFL